MHQPSPSSRVRTVVAAVTVALCVVVAPAKGYEGDLHQRLTFLAAKTFNRCAGEIDVPMLTPLQVRFIAKSNVAQADRNVFARIFNWRYYDRDNEAERSALWAFDTRFHEHFNELIQRLEQPGDSAQRYRDLGRLVNYIQLVSSPAHTVPVYTGRFWRFSLADKFDNYWIDETAVQAEIGDRCDFLQPSEEGYASIMRAVAIDTLLAVRLPISGLPASWEAFWKFDKDAGNFGEYGPAGNNFGRATEFRCQSSQRCVLLKDDPLYAQFARARHAAAVRGTMRAMLLMQRAQDTSELVDAE
jgi:hypothetical protein